MADITSVLAQCEHLPHAGRVQLMIDLGKRLYADETVATTIHSLEQQGFYERYLALYSCYGSGDGEHALRGLDDPSKIIRGLAIRLVATIGTAQHIAQALGERPHVRRSLLWKLHNRGRNDEIDTFLLRPDSEHDRAWWNVLAFGSLPLIRTQQSAFRHHASPAAWSLMVQLHPEVALELLEQWSQEPGEDTELLALVNAHMPALARKRSSRVLALVHALLQRHALDEIALEQLTPFQPNAIADLFITQAEDPPYRQGQAFARVINRLGDDQIGGLLQLDRGAFGSSGEAWFSRLTPTRQQALVERCAPFLRNRHGTFKGYLPAAVLEALPSDRCVSEARAIIADPRLGDARLRYCYLLPWDEMYEELKGMLHSSAVEQRMLALQQCNASVRFHRAYFNDLVALLLERRMEPDAIRCRIFASLCKIPSSLVQTDHLPDLTEIISYGLRDIGLSGQTQIEMLRFMVGLLSAHSEWAIGQITLLLRQRGFADPIEKSATIDPPLREQLAAALSAIFTEWYQQEKENMIRQAAAYFFPDGHLPPSMVAMFVTMLRETHSEEIFTDAWQRLYAHDRSTAMDLLPALVANDPSVVLCEAIAELLCYRRQDLVTPFLRYANLTGRFARGRQHHLLALPRVFAGGTATQQQTYAQSLRAILADNTIDARMMTQTVRRFIMLPAIPTTDLETLTQHDNSLIRTTALFALGHCDTQDGLATVIAALQDSRARIAILVIRPFLQRMPIDEALAILRAIPLTRVTVAKDVVRQIASRNQPEALHVLYELEQQPLHRDVRLVLLNELWRYRDAPGVMAIMHRVAQSPDPQEALVACPPARIQRTNGRMRRYCTATELALIGILLTHPDVTVVQKALALCQYLDQQDDDAIIIPHILPLLTHTDAKTRSYAFCALIQLSTRNDFVTIVTLMRDCIPDRRLLRDRVKDLCTLDKQDRPGMTDIVRLVLAELSLDAMTVVLQFTLVDQFLPLDEFVGLLENLGNRGLLNAHMLFSAKDHLLQRMYGMDEAAMLALEDTLAQSHDEGIRYLAVCVFEKRLDLADAPAMEDRARLQRFQRDSAVLVASKAQFIFLDDDDLDVADGDDNEDDDFFDDDDLDVADDGDNEDDAS